MHFGEREEIGLGALVCLLGAGILAYVHAADARHAAQASGYSLYANFHRTDGLADGAPVRVAGIDVGTVAGMDLRNGFVARTTLHLKDGINVPSDSAAVIHTDGLFGAKYIEIEPGGAADMLKNGDDVAFTQDSLVVDDLLERLVAMAKANRAKCAEALAAPAEAAKPENANPLQLLVPPGKGD